MRPVIGITMNETADYGGSLRRQYYRALEQSGALPLALPVLDPALAPEMLAPLDGLLLAGGADIEPRHYGETPLPGLGEAEAGRDVWELALAREAWQHRLPLLAVCRGLQLLNVALYGSLWQDLRYRPASTLPHRQREPAEQATHAVQIVSPVLGELLGAESLMVNSLHHQTLRRLSPCLLPAAF
ncbi:MAG: gamma-glutamyl-gamma-aminobutyrate hydrolase family protein, partial [Clostridiales bacterium]|nr:gamma-glutamyl-gamma-aminobutyrate hydrolase family protein [Clostridiales bacterium]